MRELTRRESVGLIALLTATTLVVGGLAVARVFQAAAPAGIAIRDAFPQAPATPLPVQPAATGIPALTQTETPPAMVVSEAPPAEVVVHVAGAVKKPGVYRLKPGARNDDAIQAAGGPLPDANTEALNLAARVEDGTQLYLPTRKEQPEGGAGPASGASTSPAAKKTVTLAKSAAKPGGKGGKAGKLTDPAQGTVNINTAGPEELQRLPGIGPAMADRILTYRQENGRFLAAEDLMQVSGIGPKKFEKMKPFVRIK